MKTCWKCGQPKHRARINQELTMQEVDYLMVNCPVCKGHAPSELDSNSVICNGCGHELVFHNLTSKKWKGEIKVPSILKNWLETLSKQDAQEVWIWLDSNPEAVNEMIEKLALLVNRKDGIKKQFLQKFNQQNHKK